MTNILKNIISKYLTVTRGNPDIHKTREILLPPVREMNKPAADTFKCPYCFSTRFVRRGTRQKKLESVQLYLCNDCGKTFTPHLTKGKHYPLPIILDALAIYHLGYSLEQTCKIVDRRASQQETRTKKSPCGDLGDSTRVESNLAYHPRLNVPETTINVNEGVEVAGFAPAGSWMVSQIPHSSTPTPPLVSQISLQPSTLANWLAEFADLCRFSRMREFALKKYAPRDMVIIATLVHRPIVPSYKFI